MNTTITIPIQFLEDELLQSKGVRLGVLRLDQTDAEISGNKYFKLKYNLEQARAEGKDTILSFGGAYSNHIAALAAVGKKHGFRTIGMIRGEEQLPLNNTLQAALDNGMEIHYMDRTSYRNKQDLETFEFLKQEFGEFYFLPEGGTNALAIKGTREIVDLVPREFDLVTCGIGTGGTIAGVIEATFDTNYKVIGFSALKGNFVEGMVQGLLTQEYNHWELAPDYSFGGFAKTTPELIQFIIDFEHKHQIQLEQIYTGKMMYGLYDMILKGYFKPGTSILAIHTGGLQGRNLE